MNAAAGAQTHAHHHAAVAHGGGGGDAMPMPMMMPMSFVLSFDTILWFESWHSTDAASWAALALALACVGLAHEALAAHRAALARRAAAGAANKYGGGGGGLLGYIAMPGGGGSGERAPLRSRLVHRCVRVCCFVHLSLSHVLRPLLTRHAL
jgi:hypothetical protein